MSNYVNLYLEEISTLRARLAEAERWLGLAHPYVREFSPAAADNIVTFLRATDSATPRVSAP